MWTRKRVLILAAVASVALGTIVVVARGGSGGTDETIIVPRPVETRTLRDVLTVSGTLRRDELRKINSPIDGRVSEVSVADGDEIDVGDTLFSLDGRAAVAVPGEFSFFRSLDVGSDGPDVEQLEQILADSGYSPGGVDRAFTESTRRALARWQLERGYGGATPEPDETVSVSLSANNAGYRIGKQNSAAAVIVPSVPARPAVARAAAGTPEKPSIEVSVSPTAVNEGASVTFTFTSDPAPATARTIQLTIGGSAGGGESSEDSDYKDLPGSFVFPAGATTHTISTNTFVDKVIEEDEEITVTLSTQFGNDPNYIVGPINSATATIRANGSNLVPEITMTVNSDVVDEGQNIMVTLKSSVELNRDLEIYFGADGSTTPETDYAELDESVTLNAGSTETTLSISARSDDAVEPDETIRVFLLRDPKKPSNYTIGSPSEVTVKIRSGDVPELTLVGGGQVAEGGSIAFTILASEPVVEDTSVNYQVSGSARAGDDYKVLPGTAVIPAGASSVTLVVETVDDDVVFLPSDMIVADWPARIGRVEVDEGEFVLQGSVLLTLTEPDFTVTLQLSPSDRSKLEVGLETTVELEAGGQDVPGTITQLDDNATVSDDGKETYEGVVDVKETLAAVDGAKVSVDATLSERVDVLAVPVAAVTSSGGKQVVRVIDDKGKIRRVEVEVGLVDDEFIEIKKGLGAGDLVVVSVDSEAAASGEGGGG
jgi:multidrug efflux pump subunit AcrA (membrane-fusion protein)